MSAIHFARTVQNVPIEPMHTIFQRNHASETSLSYRYDKYHTKEKQVLWILT